MKILAQLLTLVCSTVLSLMVADTAIAQGTTGSIENCFLNGSLQIDNPGSPQSIGHSLTILNSFGTSYFPDTVFVVTESGRVGINKVPSDTSASLDVNGLVRASSFIGDGSGLTGVQVSSGLWQFPIDSSRTWYDGKVAIGQSSGGAQLDVDAPTNVQPFYVRTGGAFAAGVFNNQGMAIGASPSNGPHPNGLVVDGMTSIGAKGWGAKLFVKSASSEHPAQFYVDTQRAFIILKNKGIAVGGGTTAPDGGASLAGSLNVGLSSTSNYSLMAGDSQFSGDVTVTGNVCASNISCSSDQRFKTSILPLEGAVDRLMLLSGVTYDWRWEEFPERGFCRDRQIGFIAQEVEAIFPSLVFTDREGYKSVDYARLTPLLLEALREQQQTISALEQRIEQVAALEARLEALENIMSATATSSIE